MAAKNIYLTITSPIQRFGRWRPAAVFDPATNRPKEGAQRKDEAGNPVWIADFVQEGEFGASIITVTTASATVPSFDRLELVDSRRTSAAQAKGAGFGFNAGGDEK